MVKSVLPKNKPIRKPNIYLGFALAKRANPIRLVVSLKDLQVPTGYLTSPVTQPKESVSLRRRCCQTNENSHRIASAA